jgi:hypothetical protein
VEVGVREGDTAVSAGWWFICAWGVGCDCVWFAVVRLRFTRCTVSGLLWCPAAFWVLLVMVLVLVAGGAG